jgi:protein TonB
VPREASELAAPGAHSVLSGPRYLTAEELDQRPAALSAIDLEYPDAGRPRDGYLVARILINEDGGADKVQLLVSDPQGLFDDLVVAAFSSGRYRPGTKDGRPVRSQMTVEIRFRPESPEEALPADLLSQPGR